MPSVTGRNPAQSYFNAIDGLEGIAGRMRGITIECMNYQECVRRYDSENTLFYCDPPYCGGEHYYGKDFTQDDHRRLSELKGQGDDYALPKRLIRHIIQGLA